MYSSINFTAIDFETAHASFPCEIGISRVENAKIVFSKSWLIKPACYPYMNFWNQRVHGISSADLTNAPDFEQLWAEILPYFQDQNVVAHNASFDMNVLKSALSYYDLALPYFDYFCSLSLSRKVWNEMHSHSLSALTDKFMIETHHHRAGDDAKACAMIVLKAFEQQINSATDDLSATLTSLGVRLKSFK